MRKPTVARPYVRLDATHRRLSIMPDTDETNLVCQDTGEVVYTTPNYTWAGVAVSTSTALGRAKAWMMRHGFRYNPTDHGYWTRAPYYRIDPPTAEEMNLLDECSFGKAVRR